MNDDQPSQPGRIYSWDEWQAGRARRRALGDLVAPAVIRRQYSSSDRKLRHAFHGQRGSEFPGRSHAGTPENESVVAAEMADSLRH